MTSHSLETPGTRYLSKSIELLHGILPWMLAATAFAIPFSIAITNCLYCLSVAIILTLMPLPVLWDRCKVNPVTPIFFGIFALFLFGCSYSIAPWLDQVNAMRPNLCFLFTPILLSYPWKKHERLYALNGFLLAMLITLLLSLCNLYFPIHLFPDKTFHFFKNHILQSFFMSLAGIIYLYRAIHATKPLQRWGYGLIFLASIFEVFVLEDGRTGYVTYCIFLFYTAMRYVNWRLIIVGMCGLFLLFGLCFHFSPSFKHSVTEPLPALQAMLQTNTTPAAQDKLCLSSSGTRLVLYRMTIAMAQTHAWFGYGTGAMPTSFAQLDLPYVRKIFGDSCFTARVSTVENTPLAVLLELGVFGLTAYFLFYLTLWRQSKRLPAPWQFLTQISILGFVAGGQFSGWWISTEPMHLFSLLMVISYAGCKMEPLRLDTSLNIPRISTVQ